MPRDADVMPVFEPGELTFVPVTKFRYQGDVATAQASGMSREEAIQLFDHMLHVRYFEDMIIRLKKGDFEPLKMYQFGGATHLSLGQEAVAVGSMAAIHPEDYITSTHRGHGHSIAKGAFWLDAANVEQLAEFIGEDGPVDKNDRAGLLDCAMQVHLNRTMAELFGKEEGYCRGRGGGMHIADFNMGHLGANAIVGGSYAMATGAAMGAQMLGTDRLCICLVGDGATNNGIAHEAMNFAAMAQFERGCPVIFLVENNQYGMTGQQAGEVTGIDYLARRGAAYDLDSMHAEVVNGMDVLAVREAVQRAAQLCRDGDGPVLLECMTYRYMGHSLSDSGEAYRTAEEVAAWQAVDPTVTYAAELVAAGVLTEDGVQVHRDMARERVERATLYAYNATDPDPADIMQGLFADSTSEGIGDQWRTPESELLAPLVIAKRDPKGRILNRHAVAEALMEEMIRDRRVILYGEDVADYGGAFAATKGLFEIFGRQRIFNAPISEACICGSACGAAMVGMRPVAELMYIDFVLLAMDQIGNQIAKNRYMFGGKAKIPLVIRTTIGGGRGYAGQHSQSLEAIVTQIPGLKVIAPATPYDTKGLLVAAIRDDNPVIFIEHQHTYTERGEVPAAEYTIPIGKARVAREGTDVTLVAYSYMYYRAMEAADLAAEQGISVEVVDPRTLIPLDVETLAASVNKTGRAVVVNQAPATGCFAEHIAFKLQEACWDALKAPVKIVAAFDVPPPMAAPLEQLNIPTAQRILEAIKAVMPV